VENELMRRVLLLLLGVCLTTSVVSAQELLYNGSFDTVRDNGGGDFWGADGWSNWNWGNGWADWKDDALSQSGAGSGDFYINAGTWDWYGAGGWYQDLTTSEGTIYQVSVDIRTEDWDFPIGEVKLIFYDELNFDPGAGVWELADVFTPIDGVVDTTWDRYSFISSPAPAGATHVRVEFPAWGQGTTLYDNASLIEVPEPTSLILLGLGGLLLRRRK
jgi:hypothetical protein